MKTLNELVEERYKIVTEIQELQRKLRIKENKLNYVKKQIEIELGEDETDNLYLLQRTVHDI